VLLILADDLSAREVDHREVDSSHRQPIAIDIPIPSPEIVLDDSARTHIPRCVVASPSTRFRSPAVDSTVLTGGTGVLTASLGDPVCAGRVLALRAYGDARRAKAVD